MQRMQTQSWAHSNATSVAPSVMSDHSNTKSFMSPTFLKFQGLTRTHTIYKYQNISPELTAILKYDQISD